MPAGVSLFRVAFADVRHGWILDGWGNRVLATTDGGLHWRVSYKAPPGVYLRDIAPLGAKGCLAVGYGEHPQNGFVVRTTDGARHWSSITSVSPEGLLSVSFPDSRHGWAVGYDGTVITTTDGGATWQAQNSGGDYQLEQVSFSDPRHGWALIGHLALLTTSDGGHSWSVVRPADTRDYLTGVATVDSSSVADP